MTRLPEMKARYGGEELSFPGDGSFPVIHPHTRFSTIAIVLSGLPNTGSRCFVAHYASAFARSYFEYIEQYSDKPTGGNR